ncbi:MAG: RNA-binding S4 domain-containing protein [Bacteroidales bacterium]|nr:RNA-binding S4 domain-containing protein [Bacteroidales bacterium]MCF8326906.1 RNA-binding S4 domain-containing protein [Bacteroidales bacterium]
MEEFTIETEYIQLIQLLKALNWVESGGMAKAIVEEGLVKVNGRQEAQKRKKITPGDIVSLDDLEVRVVKE